MSILDETYEPEVEMIGQHYSVSIWFNPSFIHDNCLWLGGKRPFKNESLIHIAGDLCKNDDRAKLQYIARAVIGTQVISASTNSVRALDAHSDTIKCLYKLIEEVCSCRVGIRFSNTLIAGDVRYKYDNFELFRFSIDPRTEGRAAYELYPDQIQNHLKIVERLRKYGFEKHILYQS